MKKLLLAAVTLLLGFGSVAAQDTDPYNPEYPGGYDPNNPGGYDPYDPNNPDNPSMPYTVRDMEDMRFFLTGKENFLNFSYSYQNGVRCDLSGCFYPLYFGTRYNGINYVAMCDANTNLVLIVEGTESVTSNDFLYTKFTNIYGELDYSEDYLKIINPYLTTDGTTNNPTYLYPWDRSINDDLNYMRDQPGEYVKLSHVCLHDNGFGYDYLYGGVIYDLITGAEMEYLDILNMYLSSETAREDTAFFDIEGFPIFYNDKLCFVPVSYTPCETKLEMPLWVDSYEWHITFNPESIKDPLYSDYSFPTFTTPDLAQYPGSMYADPMFFNVEYASSAPEVVDFDGHRWSVVSPGQCEIYAWCQGNKYYNDGNASVMIFVDKATPVYCFENDLGLHYGAETIGTQVSGYKVINEYGMDIRYYSMNPEIVEVDEYTGDLFINSGGVTEIVAYNLEDDFFKSGDPIQYCILIDEPAEGTSVFNFAQAFSNGLNTSETEGAYTMEPISHSSEPLTISFSGDGEGYCHTGTGSDCQLHVSPNTVMTFSHAERGIKSIEFDGDVNHTLIDQPQRISAGDYNAPEGQAPGSVSFLVTAPSTITRISVLTSDGTQTSISAVTADSSEDAVYYNLQGVRVDNPASGMYIRVAGGTASKVYLK